MQTAVMFVLVALVVLGFSATLLQVDTMNRVVSDVRGELLPRELQLSPGQDGPLEIAMQQQQPCSELVKEIDGITITFTCCKYGTETFVEFGARCRSEFKDFCAGFEGR